MEGPWIGYTLYVSIGKMARIHHELLPHLRAMAQEPGIRFNFNHYKSPDPHISIRVSKVWPALERDVDKWMKVGLLSSWDRSESPGYDAPLVVRRAYELASRLYLHLEDMLETLAPDIVPDQEFFTHVFHGLRDNSVMEMPRDEAMFWVNLIMRIFPVPKE